MLSIIVCSINKDALSDLERNIAATIGKEVAYEVIGIDNTKLKKPLAYVYNYGASQAKYDNLLFVHEDVCFLSNDWANVVIGKLNDPDCGVIGFAGGKIMCNTPSSWISIRKYNVSSYRQQYSDGTVKICSHNVKQAFEEVAVLDGFALFVRKTVWQEFPFDEKVLSGFHCYDIDFTLQIGKKYKNYVCRDVDIQHFSTGNYDERWFNATVRIYENKWKYILPQHSSDIKISDKELKRIEERICFRFLKIAISFNNRDIISKYLRKFKEYPLTYRHFEHIFKLRRRLKKVEGLEFRI